jgi:hypothetical protein
MCHWFVAARGVHGRAGRSSSAITCGPKLMVPISGSAYGKLKGQVWQPFTPFRAVEVLQVVSKLRRLAFSLSVCVDGVNTFRCFPRSFRALSSTPGAAKVRFTCTDSGKTDGFDSRQLHREDAGQDHKAWPVSFSHDHFMNICRLSRALWHRFGVVRARTATYVQVLYRLDGKQSSTSFEDLASAMRFQKLLDKFGPTHALETLGTDRPGVLRHHGP